MRKLISLLLILIILICNAFSGSKEFKVLNLKEFIDLVTKNNTEFKEILIDKLKLDYEKVLNLDTNSLILSIEDEYRFALNETDESSNFSVGLSKLFLNTGTNLGLRYRKSPSSANLDSKTEFYGQIVQPILNNTFGKANRLKKKKVNIQTKVTHFEVVEAYENYFASLLNLYYEWLLAHENYRTAKNSYNDTVKLHEQIKEKYKYNIADKVDKDKMYLSKVTAEENMLYLEDIYKQKQNLIIKAINIENIGENIVPELQFNHTKTNINFEKDYKEFVSSSRLSQILKLNLEEKDKELSISKDNLLPSINLKLGYITDSREGLTSANRNEDVFSGLTLDVPIFNRNSKAEFELARIEYDKMKLTNKNIRSSLRAELKNLYNSIKLLRKYLEFADIKIEIAESILKQEKKDFNKGKSDLNDIINAVDDLNNYKYSKTKHLANLNLNIIEWLRVTNKLIKK